MQERNSPITESQFENSGLQRSVIKFETLPEDVRHKIQRLRIERRMTVSHVAQIANCSDETFAAYERGDDILDVCIVDRVLKFLENK